MRYKFIISVLFAVLLGASVGNFLFNKYKEEQLVFQSEEDSIYFLEEGVYDNKERAENATSNIDAKIIVKEDAKYYVYLAITDDDINLEKLNTMYDELEINATVKEMKVSDESFLSTLEQMDGLMNSATKNDEILAINKVVLATYEEMVLNN